MTELSKAAIEAQLETVQDRYLEKDLVSTKALKAIDITDGKVFLRVELGYPAGSYRDELKKEIETLVSAIDGVSSVEAVIEQRVAAHAVQKSLKRIEGIKNIIAVASGKGGVGKSTTSANLALALASDGASVGILDADIYGPSQPRMLGISGTPESKDGTTLEPMQNHNLKAMSIGFLVEEDTPMIWRGPMVTQALEQLLKDTNWGRT